MLLQLYHYYHFLCIFCALEKTVTSKNLMFQQILFYFTLNKYTILDNNKMTCQWKIFFVVSCCSLSNNSLSLFEHYGINRISSADVPLWYVKQRDYTKSIVFLVFFFQICCICLPLFTRNATEWSEQYIYILWKHESIIK